MLSPSELINSEQYQLDRKATACKKAGDWSGAIAALRERKALLGLGWDDLKLAKYLQQAGHFDQAMQEIDWLLLYTPQRIASDYSHRRASTQLAIKASALARVHDGAALICKRAKEGELQGQHEEMALRYWSIKARLEPIARKEDKDEREAKIAALRAVRDGA